MNETGRWSRGRFAPPLAVGELAPDLVFQDERGEAFTLRGLRGRPFVVAFSSGWATEDGALAHEDALRAELRGLGASLLVIAAAGTWLLEPDDPVQRLLPTAEAEGRPGAHDAFGVRRDRDGTHALALFVVDAKGLVRWIHRAPHATASDERTVLAALRTASEALRARPPTYPLLLSRREMVLSTLVAAFALATLEDCAPPPPSESPKPPSPQAGPTGPTVDVKLSVNGKEHHLNIEPRVTLLDALREQIGLTGTKKGCDHGQCGACTVLVDGRRINACLTLAIMHQRAKITTIEGLARGDELHPMQAAFIEHDALQCGYCTPGQIMSAVGLLSEGHARGEAEIRELMSGNICRCGAYPNIVAAIQHVQQRG